MNKKAIVRLVELLGGEGEWTKGIEIALHPESIYCKFQFWNREPQIFERAYDDDKILNELKTLLFIIRWQDKRGINYQIPNSFKQYLDKYGFVELYNIYREESMMSSGSESEEIELFEKEWSYLIDKIKKENNVKF